MVKNSLNGPRAERLFASVVFAAGILGASAVVPVAAKQSVQVPMSYPAGTIIISQHEHQLYFTNGDGTAIRYPVAIGKMGKAWGGKTYIEGKFIRPDWSPPAVVARDHPELPSLIPGGAPNNPMGERALTLQLDQVAIHGTTQKMRKSVGTSASYGCIRMLNEDVVDLYDRVSVGTPVVSIP
ncbi:ErfK/YbiS/YcfS/YnhG family protein [Beijerinckiaceae bacterium RH AL1]|jgi:lipoprotein-anchoring transpeptidase ErfK/SrfK|nr:L,D-transpeptidase [Beijerinckiaceae bacterium]VVB42293.1 ErfK/YbiS/YcfS/YnhG family protein [Beijerinckiaceae bacterium RH AL8]VVB42294.1 ErfK/YbiS/YcfS/YnhG family protein [Beijerinckiaceae bacterium RH CH11]VVC53235.1 ErfK/YbiS/YcfS/YnhG family protein [Beijerinckiaceae bacterium RH AL1]